MKNRVHGRLGLRALTPAAAERAEARVSYWETLRQRKTDCSHRRAEIQSGPMHAQDRIAKCAEPAQGGEGVAGGRLGTSASADFKSLFSARSSADHVIAGVDLSAKRFVVTDCNSDNGFQTMRALDANGAEVIGLAASITDARAACAQAGAACIPVACDLSELGSVAAAAEYIRISHAPLDGIIANAEIPRLPALQTRYDVEMQFLGNYLGHFALVNNLCDIVRNRTGRIVILGSGARLDRLPPEGIRFDNLDGRHYYDSSVFYEQSKFAVALYGKELARRLRARGVAVNSVQPARVNGYLARALGLIQLVANFFVGVEQRIAATQTLLAASPSVARISGESWRDCRIVAAHPLLDDVALAERLWKISVRMLRGSAVDIAAPVREPALQ